MYFSIFIPTSWQVKLSVFKAMINLSIFYGILSKIRLSAFWKLRSAVRVCCVCVCTVVHVLCVCAVFISVYLFVCVYFNSLVVINTVLHYEFMCGQAKVFCFEHQIWHEKCVHTARRDVCVRVCAVYDYIRVYWYIEREQKAHIVMALQSTGMEWWTQNMFEYQSYRNRHVHTNAHFQKLRTVAQFPKNLWYVVHSAFETHSFTTLMPPTKPNQTKTIQHKVVASLPNEKHNSTNYYE